MKHIIPSISPITGAKRHDSHLTIELLGHQLWITYPAHYVGQIVGIQNESLAAVNLLVRTSRSSIPDAHRIAAQLAVDLFNELIDATKTYDRIPDQLNEMSIPYYLHDIGAQRDTDRTWTCHSISEPLIIETRPSSDPASLTFFNQVGCVSCQHIMITGAPLLVRAPRYLTRFQSMCHPHDSDILPFLAYVGFSFISMSYLTEAYATFDACYQGSETSLSYAMTWENCD